jgi:hypothetical protein
MVDAKAPEGYENTSTVHTGDLVDGIECKAYGLTTITLASKPPLGAFLLPSV